MFWNFQTIGNSRGQRKVDVVMYQNYGVPTKTHVINLEDKQIVFPEDDDSDIIIVNEDYNRNRYGGRVENLMEHEGDSTTEYRLAIILLKILANDCYETAETKNTVDGGLNLEHVQIPQCNKCGAADWSKLYSKVYDLEQSMCFVTLVRSNTVRDLERE